MSVDAIFQGFDDVEPNYGFSDEPLETAWYPIIVERVLGVSTTKRGAHQVRLQLRVMEGDSANRRAFVSLNLSAAAMNPNDTNRSADEIASATKSIQGQLSGFLKSIEVTTDKPVGGDDSEKLSSFFCVSTWEARELMGFVKLRPANGPYSASNVLNAYAHMDDPKKGLAAWRAKTGNSAGKSSTPSKAVEI